MLVYPVSADDITSIGLCEPKMSLPRTFLDIGIAHAASGMLNVVTIAFTNQPPFETPGMC